MYVHECANASVCVLMCVVGGGRSICDQIVITGPSKGRVYIGSLCCYCNCFVGLKLFKIS